MLQKNCFNCQKLPAYTIIVVSHFLPSGSISSWQRRDFCLLGFVKLPSFFLLRFIDNLFSLFIQVTSCAWTFLHCQLSHYRFQIFSPFIWKHELLTILLGMKFKAFSFLYKTKDRSMLRRLLPNWLSLKFTMGKTERIWTQRKIKPISLTSDSFYLVEYPLLPSQQNRALPIPLLFKRLN